MAITVTTYGDKYIVDVDGYAEVKTLAQVTEEKESLENTLTNLTANYNEEKAELEAAIAEKTNILTQMS